ncbi:Bloom syndrome protein [Linnemannia gamsii]|uniref:DNA 3'-5' helicase n=1 Tax=Linnemannia gamsii TaxID=64522 RepID=A0ABQ7JNH4_9FUNG|nr:Bloom syndrome protein [Linnemannia gamsii]
MAAQRGASDYSRHHRKKRRQLLPYDARSPFQICDYPGNARDQCLEVFKHEPKPEQESIAQRIGRGEDCVLIAGCGWGKTLAYFLLLALWRHRDIVIISPLVSLMKEQNQKLQVAKIKSVAIHANHMPTELETSCTWGPDFRKAYAKIGDLRSRVPPGVAFIAVSATLHGPILEDVLDRLHFGPNVPIVKADTDRPSVKYVVKCFDNNKALMDGLDIVLGYKATAKRS